MEDDGGVLTVTLESVELTPMKAAEYLELEAGAYVALTVEDTGMGMDADQVARCREPFYSSKGDRGTGLGLMMCQGIADRHDGRLEIESTRGEGTRVTLCIPLAAPAVVPREEVPSHAAAHPEGLTILAVDDESSSRLLLQGVLESDGHHLTMAADGDEAEQLLQKHGYDVMITDRAMPGSSGDVLATKAKALYPGMPIIMLTGFGDMMIAHGERPDMIDVLLPKPVTQATLRNALAGVKAA
jgi:CheY-like chemotaxis protein